MQIKGAVIGSVATVAVIAGGVLAIASANADNAVPASTPIATVVVSQTPTPMPVVTATPTATPTPEVAVPTAAPTPTAAPPAPAPAAPAPAPTLVQGTAPPADSGAVVVQPGTVMPPHPPGTFYVPPDN